MVRGKRSTALNSAIPPETLETIETIVEKTYAQLETPLIGGALVDLPDDGPTEDFSGSDEALAIDEILYTRLDDWSGTTE